MVPIHPDPQPKGYSFGTNKLKPIWVSHVGITAAVLLPHESSRESRMLLEHLHRATCKEACGRVCGRDLFSGKLAEALFLTSSLGDDIQ